MFRLQQAMKNGDKDEILLFFEQYFTDEEESERAKERQQVIIKKPEKGISNDARQVIGVVISNFAWNVENIQK